MQLTHNQKIGSSSLPGPTKNNYKMTEIQNKEDQNLQIAGMVFSQNIKSMKKQLPNIVTHIAPVTNKRTGELSIRYIIDGKDKYKSYLNINNVGEMKSAYYTHIKEEILQKVEEYVSERN